MRHTKWMFLHPRMFNYEQGEKPMLNMNFNTLILRTFVVVSLATLSYSSLYAFSAQICYYVIKNGATEDYCRWRLEEGDRYVSTIETKDSTNTAVLQDEFNTLKWNMVSNGTRTDITAINNGDHINLEGMFNGESIKESIPIDDCPWFQSMSVSLKLILSSGVSKIYFWSIRTDNLKAYKMVATRKDVEPLWIDGRQVNARRIEIRPKGFLSAFWKGDCWFSEDGQFIKYKGQGWGPGTPPTEIEYTGTTPELAQNFVSQPDMQ